MSRLENKTWLDGKIVSGSDSNAPILTHTFHYGSGVFEGIRAYETDRGPAVFRLEDHIDRLFYSAGVLGIEIPYNKEEIVHAACEVVKVNKLPEAYIRPFVFIGEGQMGLAVSDIDTHVMLSAWGWGAYLGDKESVDVTISSFKRLHPDSVVPDAKVCGYYVNSIFASHEAKKRGKDEALLLDHNGNLAEGPGENIFFVKDGKLYTPAIGSILPGITRQSIMQIAGDIGLDVKEIDIAPEDMGTMDEAFFVGTAVEVTSIRSIDDVVFKDGAGTITAKIRELYFNATHGKEEQYKKWLTYIN